jgi:hypothetical protein
MEHGEAAHQRDAERVPDREVRVVARRVGKDADAEQVRGSDGALAAGVAVVAGHVAEHAEAAEAEAAREVAPDGRIGGALPVRQRIRRSRTP